LLFALLSTSGQVNQHPGNRLLLEVVAMSQRAWRNAASNKEKRTIAHQCIEAIRSQQGGRFLEYSPESGVWREVDTERLIEKVSRILREKRRAVRLQQTGGGSAGAPTELVPEFTDSDFLMGKGGRSPLNCLASAAAQNGSRSPDLTCLIPCIFVRFSQPAQ
jgi:hypothetical protein